MITISELVIGFDARAVDATSLDRWDDRRRSLFLLRTDVLRPLSVDAIVWPSVWTPGLSDQDLLTDGSRGIEGLYIDLAALYRELEMRRSISLREPYSIVGVTLSTPGPKDSAVIEPMLRPTEPPTLDPNWLLLGYDVADSSMLSGLSNCGYLPFEADQLRASWAPLLNESHLFRTKDDASRFEHVANARVPEHAPFYVFGLYLIGPSSSMSMTSPTSPCYHECNEAQVRSEAAAIARLDACAQQAGSDRSKFQKCVEQYWSDILRCNSEWMSCTEGC